MDITLLHVAGCPGVELVRGRLTEALDRLGLPATFDERLVGEGDEASVLGFRGSPTVLIDGRDPFPGAAPSGLACRLYPSPGGLGGSPTVDELVEVLRR